MAILLGANLDEALRLPTGGYRGIPKPKADGGSLPVLRVRDRYQKCGVAKHGQLATKIHYSGADAVLTQETKCFPECGALAEPPSVYPASEEGAPACSR